MSKAQFRSFVALTRIALAYSLRDKLSLVFASVFPLSFLILYGVIFVFGGGAGSFRVGVIEGENGASSELLQRVSAYAALKPVVIEGGDPLAALERTRLSAVLALPDAAQGAERRLEVYALPQNRDAALLIAAAVNAGTADAAGERPALQFTAVPRSNAVLGFLPGILIMAFLQVAFFATGSKLLADRASGALKLLRLTPATPALIYGAELTARGCFVLGQIAIFLGLAHFLFGVDISFAALLGTMLFSLFGALVLLSIGYAIGGALPSHSRGVNTFTLLNLGIMFLGDLLFPASTFALTRPLALMLPTPYFVDGLRQLLLGLPGAWPLWLSSAVMAGWLGLAVLAIKKTFRFEAEA